MMRCRFLQLLLLVLILASPSLGQSPGENAFLRLAGHEGDGVVLPLWPGDGFAPGTSAKTGAAMIETVETDATRITNVRKPSLILVSPPADVPPTGVTILFAPGGGYGRLSLPNAVDICNWASAIGAHCAILKYSVPKGRDDPGHRIPLADAQRAIRVLRAKANALKIQADKIVMVGSSAGGHLTFNLANNHGEKTYEPIDAADERSARPDAVVLMYPAYLTTPIESLSADPHLHLGELSPTRTPPVFMTITRPDKFTWGALNTMLLLREAKVPAELHVYPEGGHGGCFNKYPLMEFIRPAASFLREQALFSEAMQRASDQWLDELESSFLNRSAADFPPVMQPKVTPSLAETDWSPADQRLASLRQLPATIVRLWPGEGTRDDDPLAAIEEKLPEKEDGLVRVTDVSHPTLHCWKPAVPDGRAVIIFPGGAYNGLAAQHEGTDIAEWLNGQGITAFIAKYRVPRRQGFPKHKVAFQDAQRAIRLVRSRAAEYGIKSDQIGVIGFSAGGNLAALTVHQANTESYDAIDEIDKFSARPDFAMLIYPAYLIDEGKESKLDPLIAPLRSRKDYPPIFAAVAADDRFAPDSIHYALHLHQQRIAGELHVYASGGHGKGLRKTGGPFSQWTQSCERWLTDLQHGTTTVILKSPPSTAAERDEASSQNR